MDGFLDKVTHKVEEVVDKVEEVVDKVESETVEEQVGDAGRAAREQPGGAEQFHLGGN